MSVHRKKTTRIDPIVPAASQLPAIPKRVPIDWFDPDYWNDSMTVREKARIIKNGVTVALPDDHHITTWAAFSSWKSLPEAQFMVQFGNAVKAKYKMPTEEEMKLLDLSDEESDTSEEEG